jgi:hypothetical protein
VYDGGCQGGPSSELRGNRVRVGGYGSRSTRTTIRFVAQTARLGWDGRGVETPNPAVPDANQPVRPVSGCWQRGTYARTNLPQASWAPGWSAPSAVRALALGATYFLAARRSRSAET